MFLSKKQFFCKILISISTGFVTARISSPRTAVKVLAIRVVFQYERKIILSVCRLFKPEIASLEVYIFFSNTKKVKGFPAQVKRVFNNLTKNILLEVRNFTRKSKKNHNFFLKNPQYFSLDNL